MEKRAPDISWFWLAQTGQVKMAPPPERAETGGDLDATADERALEALAERVNAARAVI